MKSQFSGIVACIILSYTSLIFTQYSWLGAVVSLPLFMFRPLRAFVVGLVVGLVSSLSLYLFYPASELVSLARVLGTAAALPPFLALALYPLLFSLIAAFSASLWSEVYQKYVRRRPTPQPSGSSAGSSP